MTRPVQFKNKTAVFLVTYHSDNSAIKTDSYEMKNLIAAPQAQPVLPELKAELARLLNASQ